MDAETFLLLKVKAFNFGLIVVAFEHDTFEGLPIFTGLVHFI
jgi:hypothetical protein